MRLERRPSRAAWFWCLVHTALVPEPARGRRRTEVLGHLWESEAAGLPSWRVLSPTGRGVVDDVAWSLRRAGPVLLTAPGSWVAFGASLPVLAFLTSTFAASGTATVAERVALLGSLLCLGVSALLSVRRRG